MMNPALSAPGLNAMLMARDERRERLGLVGLSLPALVLVALIVFAPAFWLFWLSFVTDAGVTLAHYARILNSAAQLKVFRTTFGLSFLVTLLSVALGYPLSYCIALLPGRLAAFCLALVLLPFWTSILVRTYAWLVLLQRKGLINTLLIDLGVTTEPLRLAFNATGTVIGMLHIMLPFFVLPAYASMRAVDRDYVKAAMSLGASPSRAFWTVFLPLTLPGVMAGALLVFVYCLGFYITPQILGGGRVIMVSMKVFENATLYSDWGAASALGFVLLVVALGIFYAASRLFAIGRRVP